MRGESTTLYEGLGERKYRSSKEPIAAFHVRFLWINYHDGFYTDGAGALTGEYRRRALRTSVLVERVSHELISTDNGMRQFELNVVSVHSARSGFSWRWRHDCRCGCNPKRKR